MSFFGNVKAVGANTLYMAGNAVKTAAGVALAPGDILDGLDSKNNSFMYTGAVGIKNNAKNIYHAFFGKAPSKKKKPKSKTKSKKRSNAPTKEEAA